MLICLGSRPPPSHHTPCGDVNGCAHTCVRLLGSNIRCVASGGGGDMSGDLKKRRLGMRETKRGGGEEKKRDRSCTAVRKNIRPNLQIKDVMSHIFSQISRRQKYLSPAPSPFLTSLSFPPLHACLALPIRKMLSRLLYPLNIHYFHPITPLLICCLGSIYNHIHQ